MARTPPRRGKSSGAPARQSAKQPQPAKSRQRSSSIEDQLFFTRLRNRAKWVFAALAVIFGVGFVVFGVGTGVQGASLGDVIDGVFGGGTDQPEVQDALDKIEKNPNDAEAQQELVNAYVAEGEIDNAIAAARRYTELRPQDADGFRQLAGLYDRRANDARERVIALQVASQAQAPGQLFTPDPTTPLGQLLGGDPIEEALVGASNDEITAAIADLRIAYRRSAQTYQQLTLLEPDEPSHFLRLGQASEFAGDNEAAIAAYETFLEISPDDASAPLVRAQLEALRPSTDDVEVTSGTEPGATTGAGG